MAYTQTFFFVVNVLSCHLYGTFMCRYGTIQFFEINIFFKYDFHSFCRQIQLHNAIEHVSLEIKLF